MDPYPEGAPQLSIDGPVATVTLNRPRHRNRLEQDDLVALQRLFSRIGADAAVRAVVLTGRGTVFCAGAHLGDLESGTQATPRRFEETVDALEALPQPTVCRLNGSVYGGATDLALACDFRIGVRGMELLMPAARIGLHYYPNGLRRAVAVLGLQAARRLFLEARPLDASRLLSCGYLDECVEAIDLDATVAALAAALAERAPLAVQGMKRSLAEIARGDAVEAVLRHREVRCADSDDLREGLSALAARRQPQFAGR